MFRLLAPKQYNGARRFAIASYGLTRGMSKRGAGELEKMNQAHVRGAYFTLR